MPRRPEFIGEHVRSKPAGDILLRQLETRVGNMENRIEEYVNILFPPAEALAFLRVRPPVDDDSDLISMPR
jgi:hypothetical protein